MINRLAGMDYSQGLPTPDGTGDLGLLFPEGKMPALAGLVISAVAVGAGIYLTLTSYQKAPMPASMRKFFRTGVDWYEPNTPLFALGTVLEAGGTIGVIAALTRLMAS